MNNSIDLRQHPLYQQGYHEGFKEGYNKALQDTNELLNQILARKMFQTILIDYNKSDKVPIGILETFMPKE